MEERLTTRALRSREKKKQISQVALELFSEYGYEKTTVRDICKQAGITTGTFYNFFGDKMGVLLAYLYGLLERNLYLLEPVKPNIDNPYQAICDFLISTTIYLDEYDSDVAEALIFGTRKLLESGHRTLDRNSEIDRMAALLDAAQNAGTINGPIDSKAVAEYLMVGALGVATYMLALSPGERYPNVARRLYPRIFEAVTDQPVHVRVEVAEELE